MNKYLIILVTALSFFSCSKHITVSYQTDTKNTGKVILQPNKPTFQTYVSVNDKLIVSKKNVKSITIINVPLGENTVHYVANNNALKEKIDKKISLDVRENTESTKLISVPPLSNGYWIYMGGVLSVYPLTLLLLSESED